MFFFAPELFAAISRAGKRRTVKDGLFQRRWTREIMDALTTQVLCQYLLVWRLLSNVELDPLASDRFVWKWSLDGKYSASFAYRAFFVGAASLPGPREVWRVKAPLRVKFFFWLVLHDYIAGCGPRNVVCAMDCRTLMSARSVIRRAKPGITLPRLCGGCPAWARELWFSLLSPVGLVALVPEASATSVDWWLLERQRLSAKARLAFDTLVLLVSWTLWLERNKRTFQGTLASVLDLYCAVIREAEIWVEAGLGP
jgi:hypothetical protein